MRNCIVLGSGRSGTSMVAGCLHGAGYFMGEDLMPANERNPKGYFESYSIEAINEDLLQQVIPSRPQNRVGKKLFAHRPGKQQRWLAEINFRPTFNVDHGLKERMLKQTAKNPYCFKDPRFCYTLPAWRPLLDDPLFLVVFREPGRTANSIAQTVATESYLKSLRINRRKILRVWSAQYRQLLNNEIQHGDWLFVHYDQIIDGSGIERIESALNADLDTSFPEKSLKRSANESGIPQNTQFIYQQLCDLAQYQAD